MLEYHLFCLKNFLRNSLKDFKESMIFIGLQNVAFSKVFWPPPAGAAHPGIFYPARWRDARRTPTRRRTPSGHRPAPTCAQEEPMPFGNGHSPPLTPISGFPLIYQWFSHSYSSGFSTHISVVFHSYISGFPSH